jgi:cytochrome b6-f complex iron-sulfur subunit
MSAQAAGSPGGGRTRRGFLEWFLATSVGALAVAVFYPIVRYLIPPEVVESAASTVTLSVQPSEVLPNSGQIFRFGSNPAILVRTPAGDLRAFSAVCTHLGCTVQYQPDRADIWCPCHDGHYDLNGNVISGPPPAPLTRYDVNVQGNRIIVSRHA